MGDWQLAVVCCSRCGWHTVMPVREAEDEAGLVPEPVCERGQAFVSQALLLATIAIAFALAVFVLAAPPTDSAEIGRLGWAAVNGG